MRRVIGGSLLFLGVVLLVALFFSFGGSLQGLPFTGHAAQSTMFLCINEPPNVTLSGCPSSMNQSTSLIDNGAWCNVSIVEPENESVTVAVVPNQSWLSYNNVSGQLYLHPFQEQVGVQNVSVQATDSSGCSNGIVDTSFMLQVLDINDPPVYTPTIPHVQFDSGKSVAPFSLFTYFSDPDADTLNLTVFGNNVVSVSITQASGLVYFSSSKCGADYLFFRATDQSGLFAESGIVKVESVCASEPSSSSGGGSGGGGFSAACTPKWDCQEWSDCLINGSRSKTCIDLHGCKPNDYQRVFWDACEYIPTCFDGVQNQGELGVDCGGPCRPCGTCFDGIQNNDEEAVDCGGSYCEPCVSCSDGVQNFGETGVDCGGPCSPCATCFDGIQNGDETGVDCGGSCGACAVGEMPSFLTDNRPITVLLISIGVLLAALLVLFKFFHKQVATTLARLAMAALQRQDKLILLTDEEKERLLKALAMIGDTVRSMHKSPSSIMDELVVLTRQYFVAALGVAFAADTEEITQVLESKVKRSSMQKALGGFFSLMRRFEQTGKDVSYASCQLSLEELRLLVLLTSETTHDDLVHEVDEKEVAGSVHERFDALFFNLLLTLQFGERVAAKEQYVRLLGVFEHLNATEQQRLYEQLHRAYQLTRYVFSLR